MEKYFDEFTANWNLHLRYFVLYWNFGLFVYTQNLNFLRLIKYSKPSFYPGRKTLNFLQKKSVPVILEFNMIGLTAGKSKTIVGLLRSDSPSF